MKDLFLPVLGQMLYLFTFIAIGYLLARCRLIPQNSETVLSKLENLLFLPATVMVTFLTDCTVEKIAQSWQLLIGAFGLVLILIPISMLVAKLCYREDYLRRITTYCLAFPNFSFLGLALVPAAFPELEFGLERGMIDDDAADEAQEEGQQKADELLVIHGRDLLSFV